MHEKDDASNMEIQFKLIQADSKLDLDFLRLRGNPHLVNATNEEALVLSSEAGGCCTKGVNSKIVIVLTSAAIYTFTLKKYKAPLRRLGYADMSTLILSNSSEEFVLQVESSYDTWICSPRRSLIVRTIILLSGGWRMAPVPVAIKPGEELGDLVVNKNKLNLAEKVRGIKITQSSGGNVKAPLSITNILRQKVSKKKRRFQEDGFDLDLSYITPRIIAMGFPSQDKEGIYRNPYPEVYRFMETRHGDHYKIINLCSERSYDPSIFHRRTARVAFDDHNPPQITQIVELCKIVDEWLNESADNIVAIHCKAGKGRTGTMIAAYLLWSKAFKVPQEALDFFGEKRTKDGKGVTIPSQTRFVEYFGRYLTQYIDSPFPENGQDHMYEISMISFQTCPIFRQGGCTPTFIIKNFHGDTLFTSSSSSNPALIVPDKSFREHRLQMTPFLVRGQFQLIVNDYDQYGSGENILKAWLHSALLDSDLEIVKESTDHEQKYTHTLKLFKRELDGPHKDKNKHFDPSFSMTLGLTKVPDAQPTDDENNPLDMTLVDVARIVEKIKTQSEELRTATSQLLAANVDVNILKTQVRKLKADIVNVKLEQVVDQMEITDESDEFEDEFDSEYESSLPPSPPPEDSTATWERTFSTKYNRTYYYNKATGDVSWYEPTREDVLPPPPPPRWSVLSRTDNLSLESSTRISYPLPPPLE